jgi:DNA polymerase alpha subunit B
VTLVSNPATFVIGGLVFAATSADVPFHLARADVTRLAGSEPGGGPAADKMTRLAMHCVEQRSLFPLAPAPGSDSDPAVPLEATWLRHASLPVSPDVLLLPSRMRPFVRALGPTLLVNAGVLVKGSSAGTFARITIHPSSRHAALPLASASGDSAYVVQDVPSRAKVEVVRI